MNYHWLRVRVVIMWHLCEYGVETNKVWGFIAGFFQFILHHDADAVHRRTLQNLYVTLLKRVDWYGLSGFEYLAVVLLCIQNVMYACLPAKRAAHLNPQPCGKPLIPGLGQRCSSTRATQHACQIYKNNFSKFIWILSKLPCIFQVFGNLSKYIRMQHLITRKR